MPSFFAAMAVFAGGFGLKEDASWGGKSCFDHRGSRPLPSTCKTRCSYAPQLSSHGAPWGPAGATQPAIRPTPAPTTRPPPGPKPGGKRRRAPNAEAPASLGRASWPPHAGGDHEPTPRPSPRNRSTTPCGPQRRPPQVKVLGATHGRRSKARGWRERRTR